MKTQKEWAQQWGITINLTMDEVSLLLRELRAYAPRRAEAPVIHQLVRELRTYDLP